MAMLGVACGCGGAAPRIEPLAATSTRAPLEPGYVLAVEEIGDTTIVLSYSQAFAMRGGVVAATVDHSWVGGAVVPAPDGEGRWATGIDPDGRLWRITISGELEDVTDRFGLVDSRVVAVGSAGTTTAFALAPRSAGAGDFSEIAVSSDGVHVTRIAAAGTTMAVGRGRIAVASSHGTAVWDLATTTARDIAIASPNAIAFYDSSAPDHGPGSGVSRLAIATDGALWLESGESLRRVVSPAWIHSVVGSGSRLWLLAEVSKGAHSFPVGQLYALDNKMLRPVASKPEGNATIFGSPNGDVWVNSAAGLSRSSVDSAIGDPTWQTSIAPVFARVCAHCHRPGGEADIDLSTAAAWNAERDEIRKRVIETRTMPPAGTELSDADRGAIAVWLDR